MLPWSMNMQQRPNKGEFHCKPRTLGPQVLLIWFYNLKFNGNVNNNNLNQKKKNIQNLPFSKRRAEIEEQPGPPDIQRRRGSSFGFFSDLMKQ